MVDYNNLVNAKNRESSMQVVRGGGRASHSHGDAMVGHAHVIGEPRWFMPLASASTRIRDRGRGAR